jgi:RNA polymerase sigma-70 factor (ECF subfamily)
LEVNIEEGDVTFSDPSTNEDIGASADAEMLRRAVRELPRGQRDAIELTKLKGLSLDEAAEVSGTSVAALKVATHRAIATLRRRLGTKRS